MYALVNTVSLVPVNLFISDLEQFANDTSIGMLVGDKEDRAVTQRAVESWAHSNKSHWHTAGAIHLGIRKTGHIYRMGIVSQQVVIL